MSLLETTLQPTIEQLQEKVAQLENKASQVQAINTQLKVEIKQNVSYNPNFLYIIVLNSHYNVQIHTIFFYRMK